MTMPHGFDDRIRALVKAAPRLTAEQLDTLREIVARSAKDEQESASLIEQCSN